MRLSQGILLKRQMTVRKSPELKNLVPELLVEKSPQAAALKRRQRPVALMQKESVNLGVNL